MGVSSIMKSSLIIDVGRVLGGRGKLGLCEGFGGRFRKIDSALSQFIYNQPPALPRTSREKSSISEPAIPEFAEFSASDVAFFLSIKIPTNMEISKRKYRGIVRIQRLTGSPPGVISAAETIRITRTNLRLERNF